MLCIFISYKKINVSSSYNLKKKGSSSMMVWYNSGININSGDVSFFVHQKKVLLFDPPEIIIPWYRYIIIGRIADTLFLPICSLADD